MSRATVSYVLNDTPNQKIPPETRDRVRAAAARLGYAPSAAARTLRRGRSDLVLTLLPDWPIGHTVGRMLECLATELVHHGLTLVTHPPSHPPQPVGELWRAITPAAVLSLEPFDEAEHAAIRAAGIQVAFGLLEEIPGLPMSVTLSQRRIGELQVEHLAARGHRRIGFAAPADGRVATFAGPRLTGVQQRCAALGLDPPVVRVVGLEEESGARAVAAWCGLSAPADAAPVGRAKSTTPDSSTPEALTPGGARPVTAVAAYNDEVALAVLAGLRAHGRSAPGDLAVIGVDDIPVARLAAPPLTSVTLDHSVMARALAGAVVHALGDGPPPPTSLTDHVGLALRAST